MESHKLPLTTTQQRQIFELLFSGVIALVNFKKEMEKKRKNIPEPKLDFMQAIHKALYEKDEEWERGPFIINVTVEHKL